MYENFENSAKLRRYYILCTFYEVGAPNIFFNNNTVNSEIFAMVLFSRNFAYAKFRENKILTIWRNHSVVYLYR